MKQYIILLVLLLGIPLLSSLDLCSDTNRIDISDIPCLGLTNVLNCTGNISIINLNTSEQINVTTEEVGDGRLNFTVNLNSSSYSFVDCANNSASIFIGIVDEGYGINLFLLILPAMTLTFLSLFISGRMFYRMNKKDEEDMENSDEYEQETFIPQSRLIPIVFLLFSFVPLLFIFGIVLNHLRSYFGDQNFTIFYGTITTLLMWIFIGTFLISIVLWLSGFIEKRKILREIN